MPWYDGRCIYVILGSEIQSSINYAMPVKDMLYGAIDYTKQVDEARKSYDHKSSGADIISDENGITFKLTSDEFLSGFRKDDRLTPVITATVYFGDKEWDGPLSLHEMFRCQDPEILNFVPDYRINLIAPANIPDGDFDAKFSTGLGLVFKTIHSGSNALDMLAGEHRKIDIGSAEFIKEVLEVDINIEEADQEGVIDMGEATKKYLLKRDIMTAIKIYKKTGMSEEDIIKNVMEDFDVSREFVYEILHPAA